MTREAFRLLLTAYGRALLITKEQQRAHLRELTALGLVNVTHDHPTATYAEIAPKGVKHLEALNR